MNTAMAEIATPKMIPSRCWVIVKLACVALLVELAGNYLGGFSLLEKPVFPGSFNEEDDSTSSRIRKLGQDDFQQVPGNRTETNVTSALDFAILGFPKCGTTFFKNFLNKHNSSGVCLNPREQNVMSSSNSSEIEQVLRNIHKERQTSCTTFGIKSTNNIQSEHALENFVQRLGDMDFIVMTRHPVLWFQSYYNFRTYKRWPKFRPSADDYIGKCVVGSHYVCTHPCHNSRGKKNMNVCTDRANFHHALSRLGKTNMTSNAELEMLQHHNMSIHNVKGKVFLMEISQLSPDSPSSKTFSKDLSRFLHLQKELPVIPTKRRETQYPDQSKVEKFMNICDPEHKVLRSLLVESGRNAAVWITEYFMKSDDVVVSSPSEFVKLLEKWGQDPCDELQEPQT